MERRSRVRYKGTDNRDNIRNKRMRTAMVIKEVQKTINGGKKQEKRRWH